MQVLECLVTISLLIFVSHCSLVSTIPFEDFYPHGLEASDEQFLLPNDDGSSLPINLQRIFPFFGRDHLVCYVNNNGVVSFTSPVGTFTPEPFPLDSSNLGAEFQLIAPFWADVDTRGFSGGNVSYRQTADPTLLARAQEEIRAAFSPQYASYVPSFLVIATWNKVGYFSSHSDKTNTFQCLMITNGIRSFVIFLYADGGITWTTGDASEGSNGLGGIPAQVGFNSGDGENFFSQEDSRSSEVINIASKSNVGIQGMFIFRVDAVIENVDDCSIENNATLNLVPRLGNMLGGTPVLISGLCQDPAPGEEVLSRKCVIDGSETPALYVSSTTMLCVTPIMTNPGVVSFEVIMSIKQTSSGELTGRQSNTNFLAVSPDNAYSVNFEKISPTTRSEQLYITFGEKVKITWIPNEVVLPHVVNSEESFKVCIELYYQKAENEWKQFLTSMGIRNTGFHTIEIKAEKKVECPGLIQLSDILCPMAIKVSIQGGVTPVLNSSSIIPSDVGIWSGVALVEGKDTRQDHMTLACHCWANKCSDPKCTGHRLCNGERGDNNGVPPSFVSGLPPCPPTEEQAKLDTTYREESMSSLLSAAESKYPEAAMSFYHPNVSKCYIQRENTKREGTSGQQCCYLNNGNLCKGPPGGGSADYASPAISYSRHILEDLLPYAVCCQGSSTCDTYFSQRPSGSETGYKLRAPAIATGDPHLVTLDGLRYTFNGKGEFILVETSEGDFTLQGRMEQVVDDNGINAPGTVFTAVVAKQVDINSIASTSITVEFQVLPSGFLDILVNQERVVFTDTLDQVFNLVTISDLENETFSAVFVNGVIIKVSANNGFIAMLSVSLPAQFYRQTRGLLGTFDDNIANDLIPNGGAVPLPPDSSPEDIHNLFGISWTINHVSDSNFAYNMPGSSWQKYVDPDFRPLFETVFDDPLLEQNAVLACGGDASCLFDISATKRVDIGVMTKESAQELERVVQLTKPIVCNPSCANGACIANNTCSCSAGYIGDICEKAVVTECEENVCKNNGTCTQHVNTQTCDCLPGFIGIFCQEKEPPFTIRLINSSPRVTNTSVTIDFISTKPIALAKCHLFHPESEQKHSKDCSRMSVQFSGLLPGEYIFRLVAKTAIGSRFVQRRLVRIGDDECIVNLINDGLVINANQVDIQFTGQGRGNTYLCKLNTGLFLPCRSPVHYYELDRGNYRFKIKRAGCENKKKLSVNFSVI